MPAPSAIMEYVGPTIEENGSVVLAPGARGKVTRVDLVSFHIEFPSGVVRDVRGSHYNYRIVGVE